MSKRRKTIQRDPLGQQISTFEEEEEDGVLKDGQSIRVPLLLMDGITPNPKLDAVQRDVAKDARATCVVDAFGNGDRYALSKPGARYLASNPSTTDHAVMATREQLLADAYQEVEQRDANAWRDDHPLNIQGRGLSPGKKKGDRCSIDGRAGHLQLVGDQLECVPDSSDAQSVADAYREYDEHMGNAWRS